MTHSMMVLCLVVNPGQTIQGIHAILAMGVRGLLAARKGSAQHPKFPPGLEGIVEIKSLELRNTHRYPSCALKLSKAHKLRIAGV